MACKVTDIEQQYFRVVIFLFCVAKLLGDLLPNVLYLSIK